MDREQMLREVIKKSEMRAKSIYDYKKLSFERNHFLNCEIEEEKEELVFYYDIEFLKPFPQIKQEAKTTRLAILIGVAKLAELAANFQISLKPENLYYDANGQVFVKQRDIYEIGSTYIEEDFVTEYKALIGYAQQKKYQYEDYLNGGMQLLKKDVQLKKIYTVSNIKELKGFLEEALESIGEQIRNTEIQVSKSVYGSIKVSLAFCAVLLIVAATSFFYLYLNVLPEKESILKADAAYLEMDYVAVIDTLKAMPTDRLPIHQKYMLTLSYIKTENLSTHQKDNILAALTLHGEEKVMDYWIHIGRLDVSEAQNIAMQISNDELLLYAYMKEKFIIETDAVMSGEDKSKQLTELDSKINPLSEKYTKEDE